MALQASGMITTNDIQVELGLSPGALSSFTAQSAAHLPSALTAPHAISEWYSYSHAQAPGAPSKFNGSWLKSKQRMTVSWLNNISAGTPTRTYIEESKNNAGWTTPYAYISYPTSVKSITTLVCNNNYKYRGRHWNTVGYSSYSAAGSNDYAFCSGCLLGDNKLMIGPDKYQTIESFKEGDFVYTAHQHDETHLDYYKVSSIEKILVDSYYRIKFSDGSTIRCSMSHKFMTPTGAMSCEILAQDDVIFKIVDGKTIIIKINFMETIKEKEYVYRVEVENAHTYITKNGIFHHNIKE